MVHLEVLTGSQAGASLQPSQFPCAIGRAASCSMRVTDPGIWDEHFQLELQPGEGFYLRLLPSALGTVNGQPFDRVRLRDGDLIEAGGLKLRFALKEPRQRSLLARETLTWLALAALCAGQLALIQFLTQ